MEYEKKYFNIFSDALVYLMFYPAGMYCGMYLWYFTNGKRFLLSILLQCLLSIPVAILWKAGKGTLERANRNFRIVGHDYTATWVLTQISLWFLVLSALFLTGLQGFLVYKKTLIPETYFDLATMLRWFVAFIGVTAAIRLFYVSRKKVG